MTKYFFDTSGLIKIYHEESGDKTILPIYYGEYEILISELSRVEFVSAIHKKFRNKEITRQALEAIIDRFSDDLDNRFLVIPIVSSLIDKALELIIAYGRSQHLISLDSIQIATFLAITDDDTIFVCADKRLNYLMNQMSFNILDWEY